MKPYILNYSETIEFNHHLASNAHDTTTCTEAIEQADEGEIDINSVKAHVTWDTESIEPSDDEEIKFNPAAIPCHSKSNEGIESKPDSTVQTFTVETWDEDDISPMYCSTFETKEIEPADEDEILFQTNPLDCRKMSAKSTLLLQISTFQTNTVESSDNDEIHYKTFTN